MQLDRYSDRWRIGLSISHESFNANPTGPISHLQFSIQAEWGYAVFSYYPRTLDKDDREEERTHSFALEVRGFRYHTKGEPHAAQIAPQFRIRYSREWKEADEVGVVIEGGNDEPSTVRDVVIDAPSVHPKLSFALAFPYYGGHGLYAVNPAFFYDLVGEIAEYTKFCKVGRIKFEGWFYYFAVSEKAVNVRLGVAPFLSLRTHGEDNFHRLEYGAILQLWISSNLVQFF